MKYAIAWAENGDIVGVYDRWFDAATDLASFDDAEVGIRPYENGLPVGDWMSATQVRAKLRAAERGASLLASTEHMGPAAARFIRETVAHWRSLTDEEWYSTIDALRSA